MWIIMVILAGVYFQPIVSVTSVEVNKPVMVEEFLERLGQTLHLKKDESQSYNKEFLNAKIILEGEEWKGNTYLTRTVAAQLINRADEMKNGKKHNEKVYDKIVKYKRIADLGKIQKDKRKDVIKSFLKGIMIGERRGAYSHSRYFLGDDYITSKEVNIIINRLMNKKLRRKLSPDGQLIRTTGLPKNYRDFPYILDSFPNKYYERKFDYQYYIDKLKEYKDYVRPVNIRKTKFKNWDKEYDINRIFDMYLDKWILKVQVNLNQRFNIDYRTISKNRTWLNTTRNTYYMFENGEGNEPRTKEIMEYIKKVKKNKTIIKGTVALDSSSIYKSVVGYILRARVRFKVVEASSLSLEASNLIYGNTVYIKGIKKGIWIEKFFDIAVGTSNGYSLGKDYAIIENDLYQLEE